MKALAALGVLLLSASLHAQVLAPWTAQDVGAPALAGSAVDLNGVWSITGAGTDIWDVSDQFQFVSQPLVGDGSITAQVTSQTAADGWSKAGMMIRQDATAGSANALIALTPSNGVSFQSRAVAGWVSSFANTPAAGPMWIRLTRAGNVFSGDYSATGTTWTTLGTVTIPMAASTLIGLAVTSHNQVTRSMATFTNVSVMGVSQGPPPVLTTATALWDPNPESDIAGYIVSYGMASGSYPTSIFAGNVTTAGISSLVVGTTYYFVLQAVNTGGIRSANSTEVVYVAGSANPIVLSNVMIVP